MKKILVIFLISVCWSCGTQSEYLVQSDQALETDFSQYESYNFAAQALGTDAMFTLNDLALKNEIREAIAYEMQAKGYDRETTDADLLVNFRIFEGPAEYTGYVEGDRYWSDMEVREYDEVRTYQLEAGTLMVNFVDKGSGEIVWTGYASGIIEGDKFDRSEKSIAAAIKSILDEYDFRANEM